MKTKIYYLFLFIMFFLMSCERTENVTPMKEIGISDNGYHIYECTINSHDYIKYNKGVAHSGTCKKCKQERDSIVNVIMEEIRNGKE